MAQLYRHAVVMGMESQPNLDPLLPPSGLCNAVILSKPYSSFIGAACPARAKSPCADAFPPVRWIESYRTFDKTKWASHSVTKPWVRSISDPLTDRKSVV